MGGINTCGGSEVSKLKYEQSLDRARERMEAAALGARLAAIDAAYERNFPGLQFGAVRGRVTVARSSRYYANPVDVATAKPTDIKFSTDEWKRRKTS